MSGGHVGLLPTLMLVGGRRVGYQLSVQALGGRPAPAPAGTRSWRPTRASCAPDRSRPVVGFGRRRSAGARTYAPDGEVVLTVRHDRLAACPRVRRSSRTVELRTAGASGPRRGPRCWTPTPINPSGPTTWSGSPGRVAGPGMLLGS